MNGEISRGTAIDDGHNPLDTGFCVKDDSVAVQLEAASISRNAVSRLTVAAATAMLMRANWSCRGAEQVS